MHADVIEADDYDPKYMKHEANDKKRHSDPVGSLQDKCKPVTETDGSS